jgi:hypothetical protein
LDGAHLRAQQLAGAPHLALPALHRAWLAYACAQGLALGAAGATVSNCADPQWFYLPDAFRSCYEAYTIYSFYRFLTALIEDKQGMPVASIMAAQPPMVHIIPLRLSIWLPARGWQLLYSARPWEMGLEFLRKCEYGIHGYVIEKPLSTLVTVVVIATNNRKAGIDHYGEGSYTPGVAYPYILLCDTFFQCWALYCIVLMYLSTHDVLAGSRPTLKFMCVKGVVFATFWQGASPAASRRAGRASRADRRRRRSASDGVQ